MNDIQLSKFLGWFSLGLGAFELLAARGIGRSLGIGSGVVRIFGTREVAAGLMVLNQPDSATPIWGRVVGDAMDAAVLTTGLGGDVRQRGNATGALLFVLGAAALDVAVATALTRREQRASETARRTRVGIAAAKA